MNDKEKQVVDSLSEHLEEALLADELSECKYHSREALQLLERINDNSINTQAQKEDCSAISD